MSEPKFENRPFEKLNFDDLQPLQKKIWPEFHVFVPFTETQFLIGENCTPFRDFRVMKKVPLWLARHTRYLFLPKWTPPPRDRV